jgi:hypothetical protein
MKSYEEPHHPDSGERDKTEFQFFFLLRWQNANSEHMKMKSERKRRESFLQDFLNENSVGKPN